MKLMTLNTHSLVEPGYENKLKLFAEVVLRERPDVIALQEVNQSMGEPAVERERLLALGFVECRDCARRVEKAAIEAGAEAGESGEEWSMGPGDAARKFRSGRTITLTGWPGCWRRAERLISGPGFRPRSAMADMTRGRRCFRAFP